MSQAPFRPARFEQAMPALFPTREQRLVLHAALDDGQDAISAYREWLSMVDISREFDREVFRLIPLLYANLHRLGHQDELTGRLKGAYRMAWARNHHLFQETRPVLNAFLDAGIRVMAVKGAPLALVYYKNLALRPMSDVDLVVPIGHAEQAVRLLQSMGYKPWRPFGAEVKRYHHGMGYDSPAQRELSFDLHWHMNDLCDARFDDIFWRTSQPFEFLDREIVTPDATRMLLHTILHGLRYNPEPPVRWIPDALMIVRTAGESLDWNWLVEFAETWRITERLHLGLSYIAGEFGADVPGFVLERLARRRPGWVERIERRTVLQPISYASTLGPLLSALAEYPHLRNASGPLGALVDFSHFLRYHWGLKGRREIPHRIFQGIRRRSARAVSAMDSPSH